MHTKKIAIIGAEGQTADQRGFATFTGILANQFSSDYDATVYCPGRRNGREAVAVDGVRTVYLSFRASGLRGVFYYCIAILHALFYADVLLVMGVSGGFMLPIARLFPGRKIITVAGSEESGQPQRDILARFGVRLASWLTLHCAHASLPMSPFGSTAESGYENALAAVSGTGRVGAAKPTVADYTQHPFLNERYAVALTAIDPANNVRYILDAFSRTPGIHLVIAGDWQSSEYGRALKARYASVPNLHLADPIYNQYTIDVLRSNAVAYVHGNSTADYDAALAEAMSLELPVLAFDSAHNRNITENSALYFKNSTGLAGIFAANDRVALKTVGRRMREITLRRRSWESAALKLRYFASAAGKIREKSILKPESYRLAKKAPAMAAAHLFMPVSFYQYI